jgi:hypothetical protein
MGTGLVEQTAPGGTKFFLCQPCLEAGGQMRIDADG